MAATLEVADIFRRHREAFRQAHVGHLGRDERRVMGAITACRTAALGGHVEQCDDCGMSRIAYNSCPNRHCPKCQGPARAHWLRVGPPQHHPRVCALLFRRAAETPTPIAADPRHLGAQVGVTAVLHTWGQTLQHHPHIHCVVPGGGLSLDGTHWIACRPGFFLPVRVLSRLFRRLFLQDLQKAFAAGQLHFFGDLAGLAEAAAFPVRLHELGRITRMVYAKPPFGSPEQVLAYLGRYTHRVAIANSRLIALTDGKLTFTWQDCGEDGKTNAMTLDAVEFIRRFLLHTLPTGFHRIRYYGFPPDGCPRDNIPLSRRLLTVT